MKYTSATVFYKIQFHFDRPYTQLNTTLTRTKVEDDRHGCLLKSLIFVIQKASTPKNGKEFRQKSIGVIRYCLDTLYDDMRRHRMLPGGLWCLHGYIILKGFGTGQADHYM